MNIAFDRNRGFTLIELMVSLGILAMMVLAFATILSQARSIVSGGQELLQEKSAVDAVARIMREDVRKASGHGVMCLTQDNDGKPALFITQAGPAQSLWKSDHAANAQIVGYGLCKNDDGKYRVLWRAGYLLNESTDDDSLNLDFADIQKLSRKDLDDEINLMINNKVPTKIDPRPQSLTGVRDLWRLLASNAEDLSIMWTPGTDGGGQLPWYGYRLEGGVDARDGNWNGKSVDSTNADGVPVTEYDDGAGYRAMWSKHNPGDWPQAIRFRFRLRAASLEEDEPGRVYEIIAPLSR